MSEIHGLWEYRVVTDRTEESLNSLGEVGWELVGVDANALYLKRPRLSYREQVTLDQKRRYYALWNLDPARPGTSQ